jgi:2-succinyl-5-enolpyruvyl-6-hydroxy-3-cyclohexene-1-carboxylate synthase
MKVNRNILWTSIFVDELVKQDIHHVCISPGSRNTPLIYSFAVNKKIKTYVHIDERVSGFFATGLARAINKPVVIVCTSGTATAELYPAIIEAYQQRIPLIVCTADRPGRLRFLGANQTINQPNLYKNHIRKYFDLDLPDLSIDRLNLLKSTAYNAVNISSTIDKGPVHINFPFEKPFEPDAYTDIFNPNILKELSFVETYKNISKKEIRSVNSHLNQIIDLIKKRKKVLLIAGPDISDFEFSNQIYKLSTLINCPIFADAASNLRFGEIDNKNIIINYDAMLRSKNISKKIKPELILQFGRIITSKSLEDYIAELNIPRYMINEYGDWFDPANKSIASIKMEPIIFCSEIIRILEDNSFERRENKWTKNLLLLDEKINILKSELISHSKFPNEPRITNELLKTIPTGSNIMIGNSMPIRDFDYFANKYESEFNIFNNRGASGIDGIVSTALGIAIESLKPTFLLIGDLSFYYDLNSLLIAKQLKIPLIIILINNDGGGIFEVLPIAKYKDVFSTFFKASPQLEFNSIVKGFGGFYKRVNSWVDFRSNIINAIKRKSFSVIEIKTDSKKSLALRKKFWEAVKSEMKNNF